MKYAFALLFILSSSLFSKELEKVSLQLQWLPQFEFAGYFIAKEKGFYANVGLDVEFKDYKNCIIPVDEVLSGRANYAIAGTSLILEKTKGSDVKLLASIFQSSPLVLLARKDSNITNVQDFIGKKLMLSTGDIETVSLSAMYNKFGIRKSDVIIQKHSFDINDLINKKTDLMQSYISNEPFLMEERGVEYTIFNPQDYGFDFYNDILFTSAFEEKHHNKRTQKFKEASLKGWEYAFENIEESVNILLKKYNPQNKSKEALLFEAKTLKKLSVHTSIPLGHIEQDKLDRIYDIYNVLGITNNTKASMKDLLFKDHDKFLLTEEEKVFLQNKKSITMCIDPNWMPFEKFEGQKHVGMSADYFKIFEKELQKKITVIYTSTWEQSLKYVQQRKCDLLSLVMETPKRKEYLNFTKPYLKIPLVIATKTDVGFIDNLESLNGKKIAVPKGYAFSEFFKTKYPNFQLIEVQNTEDGLNQVRSSKVFGYLGTLASIGYHIQHKFTSELKIAGKFDEKWELGIGVRNDDTVLLTILDKIVSNIDVKQHQEIFNHWISIQYEQENYLEIFIKVFFLISFIFLLFMYRQYVLKQANKELHKKVQEALEENRLQNEAMIQQARMAQMGELISMIAHQWRQPLSVIQSIVMNLQFKLEYETFDLETPKGREDLKEYSLEKYSKISDNIITLTSIIDDFRNFYKPNKPSKNIKLSELVEKAFKIIEDSLTQNKVTIEKEYHSTKAIELFDTEVIQVVLNILQNAQDNFKEKQTENPRIKITTSDVKIKICDNGGGIDDATIVKIFEPYFSTKDELNGTGLGLYMSKTIIEEHHKGTIVAQNIDDGVCFIIEFNI